jgi:hypothetical protein
VIEGLVVASIVAMVLAVGIRVGMLAAPRIGRWAEPGEESPEKPDDR